MTLFKSSSGFLVFNVGFVNDQSDFETPLSSRVFIVRFHFWPWIIDLFIQGLLRSVVTWCKPSPWPRPFPWLPPTNPPTSPGIASLSTTSTLPTTRGSCGSCLPRSVRSSALRLSAISTPRSPRATALSPWPVTSPLSSPSTPWTGSSSATKSCKFPSRTTTTCRLLIRRCEHHFAGLRRLGGPVSSFLFFFVRLRWDVLKIQFVTWPEDEFSLLDFFVCRHTKQKGWDPELKFKQYTVYMWSKTCLVKFSCYKVSCVLFVQRIHD